MLMKERVEKIQQRIENACDKSGRSPDEVHVVAVSKTYPPEAVRRISEYGLTVFGESRVQEARAKAALSPPHLSWHFIGHLQRNKVRQAVSLFDMIHAVDSIPLLEEINRASREAGRNISVCIEVNVAEDKAKYGIHESELPGLLKASASCACLDVKGLMTLPPWSEDPEKARPFFRRLFELKEFCCEELGFPLEGLSMGMSRDFEVAIEEGSTWIRVGTDLFGPRKKREDSLNAG